MARRALWHCFARPLACLCLQNLRHRRGFLLLRDVQGMKKTAPGAARRESSREVNEDIDPYGTKRVACHTPHSAAPAREMQRLCRLFYTCTFIQNHWLTR